MSLLALLACAPDQCDAVGLLSGTPTVFAFGDSILDYGTATCTAVPDWLALERGEPVEDASEYGWRLSNPDNDEDIPLQFVPGDWAEVVLSAGANDVLRECDCQTACTGVLDALYDPEAGTGELLELVDLVGWGSPGRLWLLQYYPFPDGDFFGNHRCNAVLGELDARIAALADSREGVEAFDLRPLMDAEAFPERFAWDGVHPSADGARVIADALAEKMGE